MSTGQATITNVPDRFMVHALLLKDSPYSSDDEWPRYHEDKVSSLANEIVNGNNTCYLVSGYRGVGKTSFILQVQEKAERLLDEKKNGPEFPSSSEEKNSECLFVLTNFAKYENHKSLLRRMIRDVYQEYKKKKFPAIASENGEKKKTETFQVENKKEKEFDSKIEDLYKRTFQDIKTQLSTTDSEELKVSTETNLSELGKKILPSLFQAVAGIGGGWYFLKEWSSNDKPVPTVIIFAICFVLLALWALFQIFQITINHTRSKATESKNTVEDIYDDEIADFKFHELLDSFGKLNYKLVFVLDELDKVSVNDLDTLIKEMKPYLLSGKAHFIIVAGQELAYRYLWVYSGDDAVIGSLFSKFYHIPLFSKDNLEEIGKRLVNLDNSQPDSISKLSPLFDYLIFKSRRVPRAFISRFRQMVTWEPDANNEQIAYIVIPDKAATDLQVRSLAMIKEIERLSITPKQYEPVLHDYLITQLFINAQQMIFKKDYPQSIDEYLDWYVKSKQLADKAYYQNVEEILRDLFSRMVQENIVKEKAKTKKQEIKGEKRNLDTIGVSKDQKGDESKKEVPESILPVDINKPELIRFRAEWDNLINTLNVFWNDEAKRNQSLNGSNKTTYDFLNYFNSVKAISFTPIQQKSFIDLINEPQLIEGDDKLNSFRNQLRNYAINPLAFQRQLTEFIIKQQIKLRIGTSYLDQQVPGFDAAFVTDSTSPDILIDFRHSDSSESDKSDIEKIIEKLSEYNQVRQKGSFVLIIETFFNPDSKINASLLAADFNLLIESFNPFYHKRIIYGSVTNRIEDTTIEKLVRDCIPELHPYEEFSISKRIEEKEEMIPTLEKFDPDDPQKYLWGGKSETSDRKFSAVVSEIGRNSNKYSITLSVSGTNTNPLRGFVYFLVHPSFPEEVYKVLAKNNSATLQLDGFEAFTTGLVCDEGATELELDLNELEGIPLGFRYTETPNVPVPKTPVKRPTKRSISVKTRKKK